MTARVVRIGVLAFGAVVAMGLVLGASRRLTLGWYLGCEAVVLAGVGVYATRRQESRSGGAAAGERAVVVGMWIAIVAFVIAMGLANSPFTAYDAISYHLFFPARWLQAHRLSIVPTPFSDEAQAYQPANGELWFLWLMLPFHSDILARVGQVPFYLIGAAVTYLLSLRAGASCPHAAYAPTFFLIAPPIVQQAVGANVDLIAAVMFISAIWLGLVAAETNRRRDWAIWGCAMGLFVGTKYLAVVYAPVLLLAALLPKPRLRIAWGLPGVLALGAPWYIRNWIVAGSPLYPATLSIGGVTIGHGAYTHEAMLQSFMHTASPRLLCVSLVHAFGTNFFLVLAPLVAAAIARTIVRRARSPASAIVLAIAGVIGLCWAAVGDNTDARFLLPAVALSPAVVPLAFGNRWHIDGALHAWLIAGIAWVLVGSGHQIDLSLPWFMADWLPLRGLIDTRFLLVFAGLAALGAGVFAAAARVRLGAAAAVALTLAAGLTLAIGADRWCAGGRCEFVQIDDPHIHLPYRYAARWLLDRVHGATIAYAGTNLPYLPVGSDLANTVYYVNIDNHLSWRFDQYARAYQRGELPPPARPLAQPSGVLVSARGTDAIRPRFERRAGDRDEWKMNLKREGIRYLFITQLDPYEVDYSWHTAQGFPIEEEWARSDAAFQLVYSNDVVRIYEVNVQ